MHFSSIGWKMQYMAKQTIKRPYKSPQASFFLFGPRGVGKSTWVRQQVVPDFEIDLLNTKTFLELQRDPSLLEAKVSHLVPGKKIFIDEIQKIPELLNEVHRLIEKYDYEFILTGSSARKLRKSGVNLLGGRALTLKMFPFGFSEIENIWTIEKVLQWGALPVVLKKPDFAQDTLSAYVQTYLKEEIKEEALVRNVAEFSRFLEIAGQMNGQVLNFRNISRDVGISSTTINAWYQILVDTLLGSYLQPYRPGFKVREAGHPKFYLFDCGVARGCAGLLSEELDSLWKGYAFESVILNELRIYNEVSRKNKEIFFYSSPGAGEVDFIVETRKKTINRPAEFISIEVKTSTKWKRSFEDPSRSLKDYSKGHHAKMLGVYLGTERLSFDQFEVYPLQDFVKQLHKGSLF